MTSCQDGKPDKPRLLDQVRAVLRLHHYSIHTKRTYLDWIKRYVQFHGMRSREDLAGGESKIEAFLTDLAVKGKVAASTQNQAMNALVFLSQSIATAPGGEDRCGPSGSESERTCGDDAGGNSQSAFPDGSNPLDDLGSG